MRLTKDQIVDKINKRLSELVDQPVGIQLTNDGATVEAKGTLAFKESQGFPFDLDESNRWIVGSAGTLAVFETRHVAAIVGSYIRLESE